MGEHHLHSQSPRASHERKRACPQGACSILQARVTRRGAESRAMRRLSGLRGAQRGSLPVLRSFHRTQWKRFPFTFSLKSRGTRVGKCNIASDLSGTERRVVFCLGGGTHFVRKVGIFLSIILARFRTPPRKIWEKFLRGCVQQPQRAIAHHTVPCVTLEPLFTLYIL